MTDMEMLWRQPDEGEEAPVHSAVLRNLTRTPRGYRYESGETVCGIAVRGIVYPLDSGEVTCPGCQLGPVDPIIQEAERIAREASQPVAVPS